MTTESAYRRAGVLFYAALQFVVLTTIAMRVYATDYRLFGNFFSELGATRTWSGEPNHAAAALFAIALATLGGAMVAFAGAWRGFAFARRRAWIAGVLAQLFGTLSGLAFIAVAITPINLALDLHNAFVIAAFGLLLGYAITVTILWWRNGATGAQLAGSIAYAVILCGYVASVAVALHVGVGTERGLAILVVSQKLVAYASVLYIVYLTTAIRRMR